MFQAVLTWQIAYPMADTKSAGAWIRRFHVTDEAPLRLLCFPHAGGSASYYFPVSRALAPAVEVVAVQYPGRQDRRGEKCVDDIGELADFIFGELPAWSDRPLALFGHSMGATVAYEVAKRMERAGTAPVGLFASGRRAPSVYRNDSIHLRDDDGIVAALKELSGTDDQLLGDDELVRMILPAVRGDYKAVETYRHRGGPELGSPICVLVGDSDPVTSVDDARAWQGHTTASCLLEVLPGGHFYLNAQAASVQRTILRQLGEWTGVHAASPPPHQG